MQREFYEEFNGYCRISHCSADDFYVTKEETRVEGPWSEKNMIEEIDEEIMTMKLWPWQAKVTEMISQPIESRIINVLYDPNTNNGKSWLKKWLRWKQMACIMPCEPKWADIAAIAIAKGQQIAYTIDIPKNMTHQLLKELWSGIESLKDGYVYDKRYKFRDAQFKKAHIWVFTNTFPPLQADERLRIWMIAPNKTLVEWSKEIEDDITEFTNTERAKRPEVKSEYKIGDWKNGVQIPTPGPAGAPVSGAPLPSVAPLLTLAQNVLSPAPLRGIGPSLAPSVARCASSVTTTSTKKTEKKAKRIPMPEWSDDDEEPPEELPKGWIEDSSSGDEEEHESDEWPEDLDDDAWE